MIAHHIDYQHCYEAAQSGFERRNELVSFPCPKCKAVCCNPIEHNIKLQAQHGCMSCGHKWSKYPLVQGSPLAILGCKMRDSTLFVYKLPVNNAIVGVTDNHSSSC